MIQVDQPTIFPSTVQVCLSSKDDDTFLDRTKGAYEETILKRRKNFCRINWFNYDSTVYQAIWYGPEQTHTVIQEVNEANTTIHTPGVAADALITTTPGIGLMLPVADCVATILYDPYIHMLALLHLGRHATVTPLLKNVIERFKQQGSDTNNLLVWMSPSAKKENYVLNYFDKKDEAAWQPFCQQKDDGIHVDLPGYNRQVCIDAGIPASNIEVSSIDTMTSDSYFSHASGDTTKRFIVLAKML